MASQDSASADTASKLGVAFATLADGSSSHPEVMEARRQIREAVDTMKNDWKDVMGLSGTFQDPTLTLLLCLGSESTVGIQDEAGFDGIAKRPAVQLPQDLTFSEAFWSTTVRIFPLKSKAATIQDDVLTLRLDDGSFETVSLQTA